MIDNHKQEDIKKSIYSFQAQNGLAQYIQLLNRLNGESTLLASLYIKCIT